MLRFKIPFIVRITFLGVTMLMLPTLGGCSSGGNPVVPDPSDYGRGTYFEPMPGSKHFTILPIGPTYMFGPNGYSPICEDTEPVFAAKIFAPTDGPLANVVDIAVHTAIDGEIVDNHFNPTTGTVSFVPPKFLSSGKHKAAIQLTIERNTYPPVIKEWIFDVYDKPPDITMAIHDEAKELLIVLFRRPVPKAQILDLDRWTINSNEFALVINAQADLMGAKINIGQNLNHYKNLPGPVILEFSSNLGLTTYTLIGNNCGKSGDRAAQDYGDCARVGPEDWIAYPGSGNPHSFIESEFNAWCYKLVMEPDHCPVSSIFISFQHGNVEHIYAWDDTLPDCNYFCDADEPTTPVIEELGGGFPTDPACYDDDSCYYHTLTFAESSYTSFSVEVKADNEPPDDPDGIFETDVGTASAEFLPDTNNPVISLGPFVLTGWQAAREIEGLISDPGDSVFYYCGISPPTVEEYIEMLRTEWADNIFVMAGGADPGGNLFPYTPLDLDTWSSIQTCPPMDVMAVGFLLRRDYYPLGALPGDCCGDETIPWADTRRYPIGYPTDGCAYNEEEYALWDITNYIDDICAENEFSMRVRVTDHIGNWVRSGFIEDMQIGVEGIDSRVKVDYLFFYKESPTGTPEFIYPYCDNDCDAPQSCNPQDKKASAIEYRDEYGNCVLHLVAYCSSLQEETPNYLVAKFSSNEPYVPEDENEIKYEIMYPVIGDHVQDFLDIFPYFGNLCFDVIYTCDVSVTDTPGDPLSLYVSHKDEAYYNYPFSDECEDYTIIYDPNHDPCNPKAIDFLTYAQEFKYGYKRGQGYKCKSEDNSFYSEDRYIQYGGFHGVYGNVDNKYAVRPVQSAADLIIIASHGAYHDGLPRGLASSFDSRSGGCICPPSSDPFNDSWVFSPLLIQTPGGGVLYDNDFEDNPDDNSDFAGYFWQHQPGYDCVTWILFLGCGILNTSNTFGYIPSDEWASHIGKADAICGYASYGAGKQSVVDFIGVNFSAIMKLDFTENAGLYLCEPPPGYFYRPIRAWMEANCKTLNEYNWDISKKDDRRDRISLTEARAIDWEGTNWVLTPTKEGWKITIE